MSLRQRREQEKLECWKKRGSKEKENRLEEARQTVVSKDVKEGKEEGCRKECKGREMIKKYIRTLDFKEW